MWTTATQEHIQILQSAFADLRESRSNNNVSYLAHPGIVDFHRDRLIQRIEKKGGDSGLQILLSENRPLALIGIEDSPWHRQHLDVSYYKTQPFFCFTNSGDEIKRVAESIKTLCAQSASIYTTRVDAHQHALTYWLTENKFTPVGTSIRLVRENRDRKRVDSSSGQSYDNFKIRPFSETDLPKLQDIIRRSHRHSHFFCEARFDPERVRSLFAEWIAKCAASSLYRIFIADSGGEAIGFCSAMIQRSLKPYVQRSIGIIDFIVVDYGIQGKGIGRALLDEATAWFEPETDCIELRTMADNLQAIRFYEKNGFRMLSADQHLHLWTTASLNDVTATDDS